MNKNLLLNATKLRIRKSSDKLFEVVKWTRQCSRVGNVIDKIRKLDRLLEEKDNNLEHKQISEVTFNIEKKTYVVTSNLVSKSL